MPFIQWWCERGAKSYVAKEISGRGRRRSRDEKGNQGVGDLRFINISQLFSIYFFFNYFLLYHFFYSFFPHDIYPHPHPRPTTSTHYFRTKLHEPLERASAICSFWKIYTSADLSQIAREKSCEYMQKFDFFLFTCHCLSPLPIAAYKWQLRPR